MNLVEEYKKLTKNGDYKEILNVIENKGWIISEEVLDDNILAKANIYNYEIKINNNSQYGKYKEYTLLHELYHMIEGKMANLDIDGELEIADYFASLILLDGNKIPLEKLEKF